MIVIPSKFNLMTDSIQYDVQENIGILCVNRPEARNALNWEAQQGFATAVQQIEADPPAVLIITGTGHKAFISGGDLHELTPQTGEKLNRVMSQALNRLRHLPCPVIAALNGHTIGGGAEIMTATDLRVMARQAQIRFVQVRMGLSTGWGGLGRLVALLGQSRSMDILLSGRPILAEEAHAIGLVHRLCDEGDALKVAIAWARELVQLPQDALATIKSLVYQTSEPSETFKSLEAQRFLALYGAADNQEAVNAFKEKRPAVFGTLTAKI